MTARERWKAVLSGRKPDRLPTDYWATEEATAKLKAHMGIDDFGDIMRTLHIDMPLTVAPRYVGPRYPDDADVFGCRYRSIRYETGVYRECISHPLAEFTTVEHIEDGYRWPSPDWWDYSGLPEQTRGKEDRAVRGGGSEPFLTYCSLRGLEQAMMDLVVNPDIVHFCLDRLFGLAYENTRRIYESIPGTVLISYVAEDLGSQEGLLFSLDQIREFLLPRMKRMMDLVHSADAYVFTHSDGAVRPVIADLIEIGMDVLNPVQWRCRGMDREGLMRDYGTRIGFHGGVDNQQTLAFGTVEDVREEVIENIRVLGSNHRYVVAPCHNIQAVGPSENVVAMYGTAHEYGRV